jgi:hypothetical protein
MDLFVFLGEDDAVIGFQLTYDQPHAEKAITWRRDRGFLHSRVDDGARPGHHPATPLLVADGLFEPARVRDDFLARAAEIDPVVSALVAARLGEFPQARLEPIAAGRVDAASPAAADRTLADRWLVGAILVIWLGLTALVIATG